MTANLLDTLNPQQREAALHKDGPLLILAGAGSGKTSMMTHRIAHLVKDEGVSPYHILAVTFTNKAATEMRERVERLTGSGIRMWILTFHSACLRILRKHADKLGYKDGFVVYDPTDQKVVVKAVVKHFNLDEKKFSPTYVLGVIGKAKERGKTAAVFAAEADQSPLRKILADLYIEYERTLRGNNAMDFDDLLMNTVLLFDRFPDVLAEYQERFHYIMVDEYQDTNNMQYRFVKLLAEKRGNICVVGDDDQCIYQWRGADISNILDFEKDFKGTKIIKLEQNYRSHGNILGAANSVIAHNTSRKRKKLWTDKEDGEKIQYICTYDEKEEARFVAREILKGVDEGRRHREFAVLYRTNAQSRTFEEAFSAYRVPYQVVGGVRYYDRKEIKDILSYMRLVQNPADDLALSRIINEPKRGVGEKTIAKLTALAAAQGENIFEILHDDYVLSELSSKSKESVRELVSVLDGYIAGREEIKISALYDGLLVKTGYARALEMQNSVEADSRLENLLEFKTVILEYELEEPGITLADFLEKITLISDIDNHDRSEDAVTLMTMHSAKGLEFPVVFMPGMEEGLFPGSRSIESLGGVEEERRLCYVGMTRAMEKLYLLRAEGRTIYGRFGPTIESRFLREIDVTFLEGAEQLGKGTTGYFHEPMGAADGYAEAEVIRPFDQLRRIRESVARDGAARNSLSAGLDIAKGDKVRHAKFGTGLVLDADDKTVTVMFDAEGKKKLAKGIAPLEKMNG
ncbi:MAG: UvrD-helicase domain-containing protein [Clostridiales Family XIII bacterium]|jgi:DNA helicase-2/ATP-dependent DNA helicase PcrA|nr:UvrD-helicase domain-containing protein [Clostridiales Family XIII bacterium]